jgi:hypothetical protein
MRYLLILLLAGCVHIRAASLYLDDYNPKLNRYVEIHQCSLPISVSFAGLSDQDAAKVKAGMAFWERWVGRTLFVEAYPAHLTFLNYTDTYYGRAGAITSSKWDANGCILSSVVLFMTPLDYWPEWKSAHIIEHELGHTMGLDDVDNRFHIMYRNATGVNAEEPSEGEIEALKRIYGKK